MTAYIDSSVVLRRMLNQPGAIEDWSEFELAISSELLLVEAFRRLYRFHLNRKITDAWLAELLLALRNLTAFLEMVPVHSAVLRRASAPFPTALGTLDAIHLSTALLWMEEHGQALTFLTHDQELATAARACGLEVKTTA